MRKQIQDRFARAIPGGSLTSPPGSETYTQPPVAVTAGQLFDMLYPGLQDPDAQSRIVDLVAAGTPVSEIGRSIVMNAFARGLASPDTAELTLPAVNMTITDMAIQRMGQLPIRLTNHDDGVRLSEEDIERARTVMQQMKRKNPEVARLVAEQMEQSEIQAESNQREYLFQRTQDIRREREEKNRTGFIKGRESE